MTQRMGELVRLEIRPVRHVRRDPVVDAVVLTNRDDIISLGYAFQGRNFEDARQILSDLCEDAIHFGTSSQPTALINLLNRICDERFCIIEGADQKEMSAHILMKRAIENTDKEEAARLLTHQSGDVRRGAALILVGYLPFGRKAASEKIGLVAEILGDFGFLIKTVDSAAMDMRGSCGGINRLIIVDTFVQKILRNPYDATTETI